MAAYQYDLLKCEGCGKTLGYIYISVKMRSSGLLATRYWLQGQPTAEIEKTAFCESCFQKRQEEVSISKSVTKGEKAKDAESRGKSRDRPLIR